MFFQQKRNKKNKIHPKQVYYMTYIFNGRKQFNFLGNKVFKILMQKIKFLIS